MEGGESMLKNYKMPNGHIYQFEDGEVPEGAVLVTAKSKEAANKAKKPADKARKAAKK